jgi:hypothetical protein
LTPEVFANCIGTDDEESTNQHTIFPIGDVAEITALSPAHLEVPETVEIAGGTELTTALTEILPDEIQPFKDFEAA